MQAYQTNQASVDDTGYDIDLTASAPDGVLYCVVKFRSTGASEVALVPPGFTGIGVAAADCGEVALASGATVTAGPFKIAGASCTLICDAGETSTTAYTVYALTDEQP